MVGPWQGGTLDDGNTVRQDFPTSLPTRKRHLLHNKKIDKASLAAARKLEAAPAPPPAPTSARKWSLSRLPPSLGTSRLRGRASGGGGGAELAWTGEFRPSSLLKVMNLEPSRRRRLLPAALVDSVVLPGAVGPESEAKAEAEVPGTPSTSSETVSPCSCFVWQSEKPQAPSLDTEASPSTKPTRFRLHNAPLPRPAWWHAPMPTEEEEKDSSTGAPSAPSSPAATPRQRAAKAPEEKGADVPEMDRGIECVLPAQLLLNLRPCVGKLEDVGQDVLPKMVPVRETFGRRLPRSRAEELERSVLLALNKICPENLETIVAQLAAAQPHDARELECVVAAVVSKALRDPHYSETYADAVLGLCIHFPEFPAEEEDGKPQTFRRILLNAVQAQFEYLTLSLMPERLQQAAASGEELHQFYKRKSMMLATMKFIGNLFLRKLLILKVIEFALQDLGIVGVVPDEPPPEHALECACELLETVGRTLDESPEGKTFMTACLYRLTDLKQTMSKEGKMVYSGWIRCKVQDLEDFRRDGWRRKVFREPAKTLADVREEAAANVNVLQSWQQPAAAQGAASFGAFGSAAPAARGPAGGTSQAVLDDARGARMATPATIAPAPALGPKRKPAAAAYAVVVAAASAAAASSAQPARPAYATQRGGLAPDGSELPPKATFDQALVRKILQYFVEERNADGLERDWREARPSRKEAKLGLGWLLEAGIDDPRRATACAEATAELTLREAVSWEVLKETLSRLLARFDDLCPDAPHAGGMVSSLIARLFRGAGGAASPAVLQPLAGDLGRTVLHGALKELCLERGPAAVKSLLISPRLADAICRVEQCNHSDLERVLKRAGIL